MEISILNILIYSEKSQKLMGFSSVRLLVDNRHVCVCVCVSLVGIYLETAISFSFISGSSGPIPYFSTHLSGRENDQHLHPYTYGKSYFSQERQDVLRHNGGNGSVENIGGRFWTQSQQKNSALCF